MSASPVMPPVDPKNSTVYPDWARLHAPAAEEGARDLIDRLNDGIGRALAKPGRFLDELKRRAASLPPEHLPWFWDTVGHRIGPWMPRQSGTAYGLARQAEERHGLPVDEAYHRENALLYARLGALAAKEIGVHQRRLHGTLEASVAHREFVRFLHGFAVGGGTPAKDLHRRIQASADAAGLGIEEGARALGDILVASKGKPLPDGLLEGAGRVFTQAPPQPRVRQALAELFPSSATDGGAWLRLLRTTGVDDCLVEGRIIPAGGLGAWLGAFAFRYSYQGSRRSVRRQAMPDELFALLPRLAPRIRAEGKAVRLHESWCRLTLFDADLVDLCLAHGIAVEDPGPRVALTFWRERSRRDLRALAADPALGARLAGTKYAPREDRGAGAPRLPLSAGADPALYERVVRLLDAVADGGLGAAQEAVAKLDRALDPPAIAALDGIDVALDGLDGLGPLLRTLRAGLPEELGWPALEAVVARLNGHADAAQEERVAEPIAGITCTWPVLTVFTRDRAIAVDHTGERGTCAFTLPADCTTHSVFYVGGSFLVGWGRGRQGSQLPEKAFWTDRPEDEFVPKDSLGMVAFGGSTDGALGYQFATPDGGGRYDGVRVLEPGGREGISHYEQQLGDGVRLWSSRLFGNERSDGAWRAIDPATGQRTDDPSLPPFLAADLPEGMARTHDMLTLAPLPPGVPSSPLGQVDGVSGCRVLHWQHNGNAPVRYLLEGKDGRRAEFRVTRPGEDPWGIMRLPEGGAEAVLTSHGPMRCYSADDNSLLWEVRGFPHARRWSGGTPAKPDDRPMLPPPAFWHFLTPRDATASRALRKTEEAAARAMLERARTADDEAVRAEAARVLPGVIHPGVLDGVVRAVRAAADVCARRRAISARTALIRSGAQVRPAGETGDAALLAALRRLVPDPIQMHTPAPGDRPATVTAIAADGEFLRGRIGDAARRVSLPARPRDWAVLLGSGIEAAAWRFVVETTPQEDRSALGALLRTWAASPFAEPGSWRIGRAAGEALRPLCETGRAVATGLGDGRRLVAPEPDEALAPATNYRFVQPASAPVPAGATEVRTVTIGRDDAARLQRLPELLGEHGPLRITDEAIAAFVAGTGVRRAVAVLALAGLPARAAMDDTRRMLRSKPFQATPQVAHVAETLVQRLGAEGRTRVLAAGMPDDPAQLWSAGGLVSAAERMAREWTAILGRRTPVDEELTAELERELSLGEPLSAALSDPDGGALLKADLRQVIVANRYGSLHVHLVAADGSLGARPIYTMPYLSVASLLTWAMTERPVGDPATVGVPAVCSRLRNRLEAPDLLARLGRHTFPLDQARMTELFGPATYPVAATEPPISDNARPPELYDQGLLIVRADGRWGSVHLRPVGFAQRGRYEAVSRICEDLGMTALITEIDRIRVLRDGLGALAERAADTPVPAGGYEANPLLSVPDLVDEVAVALSVGRDAAALYLQLCTLARPTDRNVRRWNGWSATRHRAVQAELVACGAVLADKRTRAGRTAFVPGGWTDLKAPHLPLETAKLGAYLAVPAERGELAGPFTRLLPPRPLHTMFADAWAAAR
ncbi:hypothetical protein AB0I10_36460 [Streptomyces sp. NPDC050636]|uniref:hypothetical protein n=1 Tax=Streptomyces sp. NPDC050636 TaxID=3154510 RepID=UPI003430BC1F